MVERFELMSSRPQVGGGPYVVEEAFPLRGACAAVATRIDRFDLWRAGAHGLSIGPSGVTIATARAAQGSRPWVVVPKPRAGVYKPPVQRLFDTFKRRSNRGKSGPS
jgi:hypothetical protein